MHTELIIFLGLFLSLFKLELYAIVLEGKSLALELILNLFILDLKSLTLNLEIGCFGNFLA